jgi:hypothetical protein
MTWFQAYVIFGIPLLLLIIGAGVAYVTSRRDEADADKPGPQPAE